MRRIKGATIVTQYCLNYGNLEDVLGEIPQEMVISCIRWRCISGFNRRHLHVPEKFKKLGVNSCYENTPLVDCHGTYKNMTRQEMISAKKQIVDKFSLNPDKFQVLTIELVGNNGPLYFKRVRKSIGENGNTKKMYFLGLVGKPGQRAIDDISELHTNKVSCQFTETKSRIQICSTVQ
jgi:hypothetical protein